HLSAAARRRLPRPQDPGLHHLGRARHDHAARPGRAAGEARAAGVPRGDEERRPHSADRGPARLQRAPPETAPAGAFHPQVNPLASAQEEIVLRFAVLLAACLLSLPLAAQTYPSKPVRLIVPYAPGGSVDLLARVIRDGLQAA